MTPEKMIMLFSFGAFALSAWCAWRTLGVQTFSRWERCGRLILPKALMGARR